MAIPSHRVRKLIVAVAATLVAVPVALDPAGVRADTHPVPRPDAPLTPSADALPTPQVNGIVRDIVIADGFAYVAGDFTQARPFGSPAGQNQVARANLLKFNLATGVLDPTWNPALNGSGRHIDASDDGETIYVAGYFQTVDGVTRRHVAAIDADTGNVIAPWGPNGTNNGTNGSVTALAVSGNTVYVGGRFSAANG
jgi:hypothetical protein